MQTFRNLSDKFCFAVVIMPVLPAWYTWRRSRFADEILPLCPHFTSSHTASDDVCMSLVSIVKRLYLVSFPEFTRPTSTVNCGSATDTLISWLNSSLVPLIMGALLSIITQNSSSLQLIASHYEGCIPYLHQNYFSLQLSASHYEVSVT